MTLLNSYTEMFMSKLLSSLLKLFERLRREGLVLGISDFLEAVEAIEAGIGIENPESLKNLLSLIFTKSQEEQKLFNAAFKDLVEPQLDLSNLPKSGRTKNIFSSSSDSSENQKSETNKQENFKSTNTDKSINTDKTQNIYQTQNTDKSQNLTGKKITIKSVLLEMQNTHSQLEDSYYLTPHPFIDKKEMSEIWRSLYRYKQTNLREEVDVEATINNICNTGFLLKPILKPRCRNQARLVILLDQEGSMTPFRVLIKAVVNSILDLERKLLRKTTFYYFHDVPQSFIYQHPNLTSPLALETVLEKVVKDSSVLIVSDAGAARGYYDSKRVKETEEFIKNLYQYTHLVAWLNPMPQKRWRMTTAEEIAKMISMFPINQEGLQDTIYVLLGHSPQLGVRFYG